MQKKHVRRIFGIAIITIVLAISILTISILYNVFFSNSNQIIDEEPTDKPIIKEYINYLNEGGNFELPIKGATGYASITTIIYTKPDKESEIIYSINPGSGFTIISESNGWWEISINEDRGWIQHENCFINLPDIIPSIVYDITNSYSSILMSSEKDIPGITGLAHYESISFNNRLNSKEYIVPVLYAMASKIFNAQQLALSEGNTLIMYEAFRPYMLQRLIVENLNQLSSEDSEVMEGLTTFPWNIGWFVSTSVSNHQRGVAIDVSLGKVNNSEMKFSGDYTYNDITSYTEYVMPTKIHELSIDAVAFKLPVDSKSTTAWLNSELSETMNEYSILLQKYSTLSGLIPIASEWWHFNDLSIDSKGNIGDYYIDKVYSINPLKP